MMGTFFRKRLFSMAIVIILSLFISIQVFALPGMPIRYTFGTSQEESDDIDQVFDIERKYYDVYSDYILNGYRAAISNDIIIDFQAVTDSSNYDYDIREGVGERDEPSIIWEYGHEWFEWSFDVEVPGLYEIIIEYYPLKGSSSHIIRRLLINGEVPFDEAHNISLDRLWNDKDKPRINNIGDEVQPRQVEILKWRLTSITDNRGKYPMPLLFNFSSGKHSIRLYYVDQPVAIGNIILRSPETVPNYKDLKELYVQNGFVDANETLTFQAESNVLYKNDPTIRRQNDSDTYTEPFSRGNTVLNILGGYTWRNGSQSVTWEFEVPEDGLYKIGLRFAQWFTDGIPVYRKIELNDQMPFREMEHYAFKYGRGWQMEELQSPEGEPYLFHLTKGKNKLTMTAKMGPLFEVFNSLSQDAYKLSSIIQSIVLITGHVPDLFYNYNLERRIPGLLEDLGSIYDSLSDTIKKLDGISTGVSTWTNSFRLISEQLQVMMKEPEVISRRLNQLINAQNTIGNVVLNIQNQPLAIDYFLLGNKNEHWRTKNANIFQRISITLYNFFRSFLVDYDSVGNVYLKDEADQKIIDVWIGRGREWADIIKEMADEQFTPNWQIAVNMNILPAGQMAAGTVNALMLAISSGNAPDVALGLNAASPVEFAIRDAVVNLKEFDDYEGIASRFLPNLLIPYEYMGGSYALPETMNFKALFYRKDIINELGIKLPETWDDLYNNVLPVLSLNNMNFFYAPDISPFLFQKGGTFYNKERTKTALDSPEAFQAFSELVQLYMSYGVPEMANFFNRMRSGEMPMGIGSYYDYMLLSNAAPELYGRWGIASVPGTRRQDGTIDRTIGGIAAEVGVILSQTSNSAESWEFLKWWTSTETQEQFGRELEALIGVEARWNTANIEAFQRIPWKREDMEVLKEQWIWYKEMPVTLGGYFTTRHINNAWYRSVIGGMRIRDSLEKAVEDINRELRSKHEEYGIKINSRGTE